MMFVAFAGLAGAGKSTLSKLLAKMGLVDGVEPFAKPIRNSLAVAGVTKETDLELYRYLAQTIGAKCREANPDWWVNLHQKTMDDIRFRYNRDLKIALDDLRYPNEYNYAKKDGVVIYLDAFDRIQPDETTFPYNHESEAMALAFYKSESEKAKYDLVIQTNDESAIDKNALLVQKFLKEKGLLP